jgi:hypothetical protein
MPADHAVADYHDLAETPVEQASRQQAAAAGRPRQVVGAHGDRHVAGHRAHGREQWQPAQRILDRLIGDGRGAASHQGAGEAGRCAGQVQIGEQQLSLQQGELCGDGLLYLDYQIGVPGTIPVDQLGARRPVVGIVEARTRAGFDQHLVSAGRQCRDPLGDERHPVLVRLALSGYADSHD